MKGVSPMRLSLGVFAVCMCLTLAPLPASAQTSSDPTVTVPRVVSVSGAFTPADGQAPHSVEVVTLSIYAEPEGGLPLWQERQSLAVDPSGRFTLMAGATHPAGIPVEVFG